MHEVFEHTADLGLRVQAPNLNALFAEAGQGLFEMIVEDPSTVRPELHLTYHLEGQDREYLLFDWLNELLFTFDTQRLLLTRFSVQINETGLEAEAHGERFDPERHVLDHEVKAITYHGLKVKQVNDGWQAEVIVDI